MSLMLPTLGKRGGREVVAALITLLLLLLAGSEAMLDAVREWEGSSALPSSLPICCCK